MSADKSAVMAEPKIEIVYQPRSEWPEKIVTKFHEFHVKMGTSNPNCPHCIANAEAKP